MAVFSPVLTALAVAYPLVNHLFVTLDMHPLGLIWLALVMAAGYLLGSRSPVLLGLAVLVMAAALISKPQGNAELLLRLPPVVVSFSFAWVFGRTLLPGRTALVSRIGGRGRGEPPASLARYGRCWTWIWALFLALMGLECILLGLYASPFWWSLFTNFINYLLIALLLVVEYPIRRLMLRDLEHAPFIESLRGSLRLDMH